MSTITILAHGLAQPKRISNGLATIRRRILAADEIADVRCYSWRQYAEIPDIADKIRNELHEDARIVMAAHSWGAFFVCRLANKLRIRISAMLLADGVQKPPRETLIIPSYVARLYTWRQESGLIQGSPMSISPRTVWEVDERVDVPHHAVDEVKSFQDAVYAMAVERG